MKGVLLGEQGVLSSITLRLSGEVDTPAKVAYEKLLTQAQLKPSQVDHLFTTRVESEKVSLANGNPTEMLSHQKGAHWLFPGNTTVLDLGAQGIRILRGGAEGNLTNFLMNDKCAARTGIFLETVAMMMRISLPEMGPLAIRSSGKLVLTSTCAIFAESEIVAEIHRRTPPEDILAAVHESIASKIAQLARYLQVPYLLKGRLLSVARSKETFTAWG